jgi:hypothetical protein
MLLYCLIAQDSKTGIIITKIKTKFSISSINYTPIYFVLGILRFLPYPQHTPDLNIQRQKIFEKNIFMDIAKIFIVITAIMKIPSNFKTFKLSILKFIFERLKLVEDCNSIIFYL